MAKRAKKAKRKVVKHGTTDGIRIAVLENSVARLNRRIDKIDKLLAGHTELNSDADQPAASAAG